MTNHSACLRAPHLFILAILSLAAPGASIAQAAEAASTTTASPTSSLEEVSDTDLDALREAADCEYSAGRYRKAIGILETVIHREKQAQAPALDVARFQLLLARSYQHLGRLAEAGRLLEDVIAVRERILGTRHTDLAFPLHLLGANHRLTRDYANARKLHDRALSITRNTQGEDSDRFALGLLELGMLADDEGYKATAGRYYREVVQILATRGESNHPVMATALRSLGVLLSNPFAATGARYREARTVCERALAIVESQYPDHPDLAYCLAALGNMSIDEGDFSGAFARLNRALMINEGALGPDHPRVARDLAGLGRLFSREGHYEAAANTIRRGLGILEKRRIDPDAIVVLRGLLGMVKAAEGHEREATEWLRQAMDYGAATLGIDDHYVRWARTNLTTLYALYGKADTAERMLRTAITNGSRSAEAELRDLRAKRFFWDSTLSEVVTRLANQGNAVAQNLMGAVNQTGGPGRKANYATAVDWYRRAAEAGHAGAQNNLGWMYDKGLGVTEDPVHAATWYRRSALQGHAVGQNNLGEMYRRGRGVPQRPAEAISWYQLSARQRHGDACVNLGAMYARGLGVRTDLVEAWKYWLLASEFGATEGAERWMAEYRRALRDDQLQEAERRARSIRRLQD